MKNSLPQILQVGIETLLPTGMVVSNCAGGWFRCGFRPNFLQSSTVLSIEILDLPEIFRPIVPPLIRLIFDAFRSPTAFSLHAITDERQFEL